MAAPRTRAGLEHSRLGIGFGNSSVIMFSFYKVKTKTTSGLGVAFMPTETQEDFRVSKPPFPHTLTPYTSPAILVCWLVTSNI